MTIYWNSRSFSRLASSVPATAPATPGIAVAPISASRVSVNSPASAICESANTISVSRKNAIAALTRCRSQFFVIRYSITSDPATPVVGSSTPTTNPASIPSALEYGNSRSTLKNDPMANNMISAAIPMLSAPASAVRNISTPNGEPTTAAALIGSASLNGMSRHDCAIIRMPAQKPITPGTIIAVCGPNASSSSGVAIIPIPNPVALNTITPKNTAADATPTSTHPIPARIAIKSIAD